jgi:hypothetical protein
MQFAPYPKPFSPGDTGSGPAHANSEPAISFAAVKGDP